MGEIESLLKKDLFKLGGFLLVVLGCWLVFNRGGLAEVKAGKAQGKEQVIRVVSWNLNWFPGGKEKATAEEAAAQMGLAQKAIGDLKPDLLLLQEVRDWKGAEELCREVPEVRVQVISRFQPRPQNEVLATNFLMDGGWSDEWKRGDEDPPRGYVFGAIEVQPGRFLLVYSVHLKSNVGPVEVAVKGAIRKREDSARQLLKHVGEMLKLYGERGKCAVMICGDLNTHADGGEFAKERTISALQAAGFRSGFEGVLAPERVTHPAKGKYGDACFDYIFTLGMGEQRAVVKGYPGVSDHQPVVMEVDLGKVDWNPRWDLGAGLAMVPGAAVEMGPAVKVEKTIRADDAGRIRGVVGETVAVRGTVERVSSFTPKFGGTIHFINFVGSPKGEFVGIVKEENFAAVRRGLGGELAGRLAGKRVELRGEVVLYKGETPEIIVETASQIVLEGDLGDPYPKGQGGVPPIAGAAVPKAGACVGGYVASANSDKFHKVECLWAKKVNPQNRVLYETRELAIGANLTPCKNCHP